MKKLRFLTIIFITTLESCSVNSQQTFVTPSSSLDSVFTSIKDNDVNKLKRQLLSIDEGEYLHKLENKQFDKKSYELLTKSEELELEKVFNSLKDSITKYNITIEDQIENKFHYYSEIDDRNKKRYDFAQKVSMTFLKDSTVLSIYSGKLLNFNNHWKMLHPRLLISVSKQNDYTNTGKVYPINSTSRNLKEYGEYIYQILKEGNIEKIASEYPNKRDFEQFNFSEERVRKGLIYYKKDFDKVKENIKNFDIINSHISEKISIVWKTQRNPMKTGIKISLFLKTSEGDKLLDILCIATEKRIIVGKISTEFLDVF